MSATASYRLDLVAFLAFAEAREGKWELFDGVPVEMARENARHGEAKLGATIALSTAAGSPVPRFAGLPLR